MDNIGNQKNLEQGTVKWFDEKKGFGFIENQSGQYFVHFSEIQSSGFKVLNKDDHVQFEIGSGPKGAAAKNVSLIKAADDG